jgi:transposase-like protein
MAAHDSALSDLSALLLATDGSLSTSLAEILATAVQELIEAELTRVIGAEPGERSPIRSNLRNGHRPKLVSTPAGDIEGGIPKLRKGSFFPELLEPRRRIDKGGVSVLLCKWVASVIARRC